MCARFGACSPWALRLASYSRAASARWMGARHSSPGPARDPEGPGPGGGGPLPFLAGLVALGRVAGFLDQR